jgi:MYXO-CTERM domain-containing protein
MRSGLPSEQCRGISTDTRSLLMNRNTISRTLAVAGATGIASLAFCAPASAARVVPPSGGESGTAAIGTAEPVGSPDSGWDPTFVGAAGAVALVGAGAVVLVRRRHSGHEPHPI